MASRKYRTLTIEIKDGKLDQTALTREQMDLLERKPVVYIYYNKNVLYVGETSGFLGRHEEHLKETGTDYRQFTHVIVLFGQYVDRNSQLDLERQLITYLITERETRLGTKIGGCLNRQLWRRVPDYRTKEEVYSQVLVPFWTNELKEAGIIEEVLLDNLRQSILFKYSPFQELSEEQHAFHRRRQRDPEIFPPAGCGQCAHPAGRCGGHCGTEAKEAVVFQRK